MQCNEIQRKLDAWISNEIPDYDSDIIKRHIEQCPKCRREAEAIKNLSDHLERLPDIHAPGSISRKIRSAFQKELIKPGLAEWWKSLSFSAQSAVFGVILTGLLCGAILCNSVFTTGTDTSSDPYQTLYDNKGILL